MSGQQWSAARPGRTLPTEKPRYPFYRRLGELQGQSGRAEKLVTAGIQSRTVHLVAQSLYRLSYPAHIFTCNININILLYRHIYFRCVFLSHDLKDKIIFLPSSKFLWQIFEALKRLVKIILASREFFSLPFFPPKWHLRVVQQTHILWHAFLGILALIWRFTSCLSAFTFVVRLSHERKKALFIYSSCEISRTVRIFMKFLIRKFYEKFSTISILGKIWWR